MKKLITHNARALIIISITLILWGCKKEKGGPSVDENGLTQQIKDLVPDSVLSKMKELGMPIYGGDHPPMLTKGGLLEIQFHASPLVLKSSNRPGDYAGMSFADYDLTFKQQDNSALTIVMNYVNGTESGNGLGSYIVGDDCNFTVFVRISSTHSGGTSTKGVKVISGTMLPNAIGNLHISNFMLDDYGDPQDVWIENGQGRVAYDKDGYSEIVGTNGEWYNKLPDCPCTYNEAKSIGKTKCPEGEWEHSGWWLSYFLNKYHYGAKYEVRWTPSNGGKNGQQCTYDAQGNLITSGIAAGSADLVAPGITDNFSYDHDDADVKPWEKGHSNTVSCETYLKNWPSNPGSGCKSNPVNDITHLYSFIENMSCEEVVSFFKAIDQSTDNVLIQFIHNTSSSTPIDLKQRLINLRTSLNCDPTSPDDYCAALSKVIDNI